MYNNFKLSFIPSLATNSMKGIYSVVGFILFVLGTLALILSLVGVKLLPLLWIDSWGALPGLVIRVLMILSGVLIVYLARSDWRNIEDDGYQS